ncbi:chemotaxis protein CheW [Scytonema sp. NUACC21]
MSSFTALSNSDTDFCWNVTGVAGDCTCSKLTTFSHCRNCPVYSATGRQLLERSIPENYRRERTQLLAESGTETENKPAMFSAQSYLPTHALLATETLTVVIFRLQREWLALPARVFKETTPPSVIHTIPYRTNQILRGLVSIRGELQLCISLTHLLNLEIASTPPQALSPVVYSRMVVVEKAGSGVWVFTVDELYGVHSCHQDELLDTPKGTQGSHTYTKGLLKWRDRSVSFLDDELLFHTLSKKVTS